MKILPKRRRRENKTNYLKRKRLLEGRKPRIVIRKTNRYIILQFVESKFAQDKITHSVNSKELLEHGWPKEAAGSLKSIAAAYLSGLLFGKKIAGEKDKKAILDIGLVKSTKGSRIYAGLKGIIDSGIQINCKKEMLPEEKRIQNSKAKDFFDKVKQNIEKKEAKK